MLAAGKETVIQKFINGKVWTSYNLEKYADFFGQCLEKAELAKELFAPGN
jgi:hypothetical protein